VEVLEAVEAVEMAEAVEMVEAVARRFHRWNAASLAARIVNVLGLRFA
jgi:hypothetical protein